MSDNIALYCLVEDDPIKKVFGVKLEKNNIMLWKVEVPTDEETVNVKIVLNDIQEKLELSYPFKKIGNIFTKSIPDDSIQIIVERPSGEKRKKENKDLRNEITRKIAGQIAGITGQIAGIKGQITEIGHEVKKIRLQSEQTSFTFILGVTTATEKGKFVIEH
ncbi:27444_t:CDS:2, partial [Gigaspora margarita]